MSPRAPFVVASTHSVPLSRDVVWLRCHFVPGRVYRLRALLEGASTTENLAALVRLDTEEKSVAGEGLRLSSSVGPHFYLRTGPGLCHTDHLFSPASPAHRLGIMAWGNRGPVEVKTLTLEEVDTTAPAAFFFSFDVEAARKRAAGDPIDTLVWGRVNGGEYGIRRICEVIEQYGIKGNFLIDFATCGMDGEVSLGRIVDFLAGRGHEIHMHLHPAGMVRSLWGLRTANGEPVHFDNASYDMSRRLLDFTMSKYEEFVGQRPRLFRSGAYKMNRDFVLAAGSLGIEALSNVRPNVLGYPGVGGDPVSLGEPFAWENGVVEIPVDSSSPEAGSFEAYLRTYNAAVRRKNRERTFNIVMHSFSLLRRNAEGVHDSFAPEYEEMLHRMCEHALKEGTAYGYAAYLDSCDSPRPLVRMTRIKSEQVRLSPYLAVDEHTAECNICDARFARSRVRGDSCPCCGLGSRHRQLKSILETLGDVFGKRRVAAYGMGQTERRRLLSTAAEVTDISSKVSDGRCAATDIRALNVLGVDRYDCLLWFDVLTQSNDVSEKISAIARMLAPGGVLVAIVEPSETLDGNSREAFAEETPPGVGGGRGDDPEAALFG